MSDFDESKWDHTEHLLPQPYGTLCSLHQAHLQRYAFARWYCQDSVVLDAAVGCGYGALLIPASRYIGVDRDSNCVAFARKYYAPLFANASFETGDVTSLPVIDASVDRYISFETIEHLPPDALSTYFTEAKRALRHGGLLLCSSPIYRGDRFGLASPHHKFEFAQGQFQNAIGEAGFRVQEVWHQSPFLYIPSMTAPPAAWTQGCDPHITICIAAKI